MTSDLIARFDAEHNAYHNVSPARRTDSRRVLAALRDHAGGDLLAAGGPDVQSYLATLVESGMAATTVKKYVNLIRPFYRWAHENDLVSFEQYMRVKMVKPPRGASAPGKPRPYSRDTVKKLWADVDAKWPYATSDYYLKRFANGTSRFPRISAHANRLQVNAIIALALFGGLRREEIFRSKIDDIHPDNAYVVVRGAKKNRDATPRDRAVPWTVEDMRVMVHDWIVFREWLAPDHDSTWLSLYHHPHYRKPMRFTRFALLASGIGDGWELHRMRHTAITEMLRAGYPLHEVQRIAGHARIQQTLAYAELLPDDLVKTAARQSSVLSAALCPKPQPQMEAA